jgi:hypothetical protein
MGGDRGFVLHGSSSRVRLGHRRGKVPWLSSSLLTCSASRLAINLSPAGMRGAVVVPSAGSCWGVGSACESIASELGGVSPCSAAELGTGETGARAVHVRTHVRP